ncbi:MAG: hypothetical protein KDC27_05845 [Acidobacteria bacterium]|nr:hypothetical protein [Acidobacteriota bacterium]
MTTITFYQSAICPRCKAAGLWLNGLLTEFPDVRIEKVELLTNLGRARQDGVSGIPALVTGDRRLSGFFLTKKRIREFLESLDETD